MLKWKVVYEEVTANNNLVRRTRVYEGKDANEVRVKVLAELNKAGAFAIVRSIVELKADTK